MQLAIHENSPLGFAILISNRGTDVIPFKYLSVTFSTAKVFDSLRSQEICAHPLARVRVLLLAPVLNENKELVAVSVSAIHQY